jgi:hypothetical protein
VWWGPPLFLPEQRNSVVVPALFLGPVPNVVVVPALFLGPVPNVVVVPALFLGPVPNVVVVPGLFKQEQQGAHDLIQFRQRDAGQRRAAAPGPVYSVAVRRGFGREWPRRSAPPSR